MKLRATRPHFHFSGKDKIRFSSAMTKDSRSFPGRDATSVVEVPNLISNQCL